MRKVQKQNGLALWNARIRRAGKADSTGLASIVVVFILIVVLSLISIGFTKIINRGTQSSVSSQLAAAATAAAQSGITEVANYIKNNPGAALPPASSTNCTSLFGSSNVIPNKSFGAATNTNYSCILADKTPTSLQYQNLPPYKSQVVKLQPDSSQSAITKLMFSWQSSDRTKNVMLPPGHSLYDETYWSNNKYSPLLSVSLYPIFSPDSNLSNTKSNTKTFFLYPENGSTGTMATLSYSAASGLQGVDCNAKGTSGVFNGTADYDCNAVITSLPASAVYYYARIAPVYNQTDVKIKANSSSETTKFKDAQAQIDVTANSGGASKRLQARVNIGTAVNPTDDAIPESALRSAGTLCKRLVVDSTVHTDSQTGADCGLTIANPVPTVSLSASPSSVVAGGSTTLTWSSTNATSCAASSNPDHGNWSGGALNGSNGVDPLNSTTSFTLTCSGSGGSATATFEVRTLQPPVLRFWADSYNLPYNGSTTLHWRVDTGPATWCFGSGGSWGSGTWKNPAGGDESTGSLDRSQRYYLQCGNNSPGYNDYHTQKIDFTINVASPPPPPPRPGIVLHVNGRSSTTVEAGSKVNRDWRVENATSCTASSDPADGDWGPKTKISLPTGSTNGGTYRTNTTLYLTCTGSGGTNQDTAKVKISGGGGGGGVDANLFAVPDNWPSGGGQSNLSWNSSGADTCNASGGWSGNLSTGGSTWVNVTSTTTYSITCRNNSSGASGSDSKTVTVDNGGPPPPPPAITVYDLGSNGINFYTVSGCRDGLHNWTVCLYWSTSAGATSCVISYAGNVGSSSVNVGPGGSYTLGYNGTQYSQFWVNVNITCSGAGYLDGSWWTTFQSRPF